MTIKQQGGIFGRNPTFNTVDVDSKVDFGNNNYIYMDGNNLTIYGKVDTTISSGDGSYSVNINDGNGAFRPSTNTMNLGAPSVQWGSAYIRNAVVLGNGGGIDFSATAGTGTSELFDDYEEGAASLTVTSGAGTITTASASAVYTKIGRSVILNGGITITNNGTGSSFLNVAGLPFTPATAAAGVGREGVNNGKTCSLYVSGSSTTMKVYAYDNTYPVSTGSIINFTVVYSV